MFNLVSEWEDISKTIKAQLYERAKNPLLASFVISFCCINYKFFLTLTASGMKLSERIAKLESFDFSFKWPILIAVIYAGLLPLAAIPIYWYTRWQQRVLRGIRLNSEQKTPLTPEESDKVKEDAREQKKELTEVINRIEDEVRILKESAEIKNKQYNELVSKNQDLEEEKDHLGEQLADSAEELNAVKKLKLDLKTYQEENEKLIKEQKTQIDKIKKASIDINQLEDALAKRTSELHIADGENSKLENDTKSQIDTIKKSKVEIDKLKIALGERTSEVKTANNENKELQKQLQHNKGVFPKNLLDFEPNDEDIKIIQSIINGQYNQSAIIGKVNPKEKIRMEAIIEKMIRIKLLSKINSSGGSRLIFSESGKIFLMNKGLI
jgi:myosin heavy subunit